MTPLLLAADARIEIGGAVLADSLSFCIDGNRVGLFGDWTSLFRLFSRVATLTRGKVRLTDQDAEAVVFANRLGIAPFGGALPRTWSTNEYLATGARLLGLGRRAAARAATDTLDELGLGALRKRSIGALDETERRALVIAQATLGNPPVLLLDRPFDGLSDPGKIWIDDVVDRAARGRRLVLATRAPAAIGVEARLVQGLDQIAIMAEGQVVAVGSPRDVLSTSRRCIVRASRELGAFSRALVERGLRVERLVAPDDGTDDGRLVVDLPEGTTSTAILDAALAAQAPLLELAPIGFEIRK